LNCEHIAIELHRLDGGKPSLERLIVDVVFDDSQALGPNAGVVLVHAESVKKVQLVGLQIPLKRVFFIHNREGEFWDKSPQKKNSQALIFDEF
jgi:hypothetical protein